MTMYEYLNDLIDVKPLDLEELREYVDRELNRDIEEE